MVIGADQVVRSGLAGGVGAVRLVGVGFLEGWVLGRERAVDLIGGDMQEAKVFLSSFDRLPQYERVDSSR